MAIEVNNKAELARIIGKESRKSIDPNEVNRLSLKVLGVLAEAQNNETRRRALEKARRMLSQR